MTKTDASIKNICLAAIRRHTIGPFDFSFSRIFEESSNPELPAFIAEAVLFHPEELCMAATIINPQAWTLVTTQRIISRHPDQLSEIAVRQLQSSYFPPALKRPGNLSYLKGRITVKDGTHAEVWLESGRAAMIMVYAVHTLIGINR